MTALPHKNKVEDLKLANKSIMDLYEDKLYLKKKKPHWKSVSDASAINARLSKNEHVHFSEDVRSKPKYSDKTTTEKKIREVQCLNCSGIDCAMLMEKTEDVFRECCHACKARFLNTLPYSRKKKDILSKERDFARRNFEQNNSDYRSTKLVQSKERLSEPQLDLPSNTSSRLYLDGVNQTSFKSKNDVANNGLARSVYDPTFCSIADTSIQSRDDSCTLNPLSLNREAFLDPDQLIYSRHRSLIAAGKMKQQAGKKPVRVHLLSGDSILLVFDPKVLVKEVFEQICALHSIKETHFFGLSAIVDNEHRFMDLKLKLSKYAPKEWGKEPKRRTSDLSVQPSSVFTVQFQVQYYVEHPKLISNQQSRHLYYLQLKRNVLQSKVAVQDEIIFTLAATALHLDKGSFDSVIHHDHYFDPRDYVPNWFLQKWSETYLWSHLPKMHQELISTSTYVALSDYIKQASLIDDVPVHYHRLYKNKGEPQPSVIMGIFNRGIRLHHVTPQGLDGPHLLDFEFPWNKVGRLFFSGKRFEIFPEDQPSSRKLIYYTGSRSRSKYLLRLLRETHSLFMSLSPFVDHMREVDGKTNRKRFRESYISGMNLEERNKDRSEERFVGFQNKSSVDEKSTEKISDQIDVGRLITSKSSTSHGSSHTSGVESDAKVKDLPEIGDDNAFSDDYDPIEVDTPPSGDETLKKQQHSTAPSQENLSSSTSKSSDLNKHNNVEADDTDDLTPHNNDSSLGGDKEELPVKRDDSFAQICLDIQTLSFKKATLRNKSSTESIGNEQPSSSTSEANDGVTNSLSSEDMIASILHHANLDPVSPEKHQPQHNDVNSSDKHRSFKESEVKVHDSSKEKSTEKRVVAEVHEPQRDYSTEGRKRRSGRPKSEKGHGHRRHKSAHEVELHRKKEKSSEKHFGEPLSQKQSYEDLTNLPALGRSEKRGDIPSVLTSYPSDQFQYHKKLEPTDSNATASSRSVVYPVADNPIIAVHLHKPGSSSSTTRRKANKSKRESDRKNRSDSSGYSSKTPTTPNGYAVGAAGFTPIKPAPFLLDRRLTSSSESSYSGKSYILSDLDLSSDSQMRAYCKIGSEKYPAFVESYKEVIV